jgi:hypothetical protein
LITSSSIFTVDPGTAAYRSAVASSQSPLHKASVSSSSSSLRFAHGSSMAAIRGRALSSSGIVLLGNDGSFRLCQNASHRFAAGQTAPRCVYSLECVMVGRLTGNRCQKIFRRTAPLRRTETLAAMLAAAHARDFRVRLS